MGYVIAMYATDNDNDLPGGRAEAYYWYNLSGDWGKACERTLWHWVCEPYYEDLDFLICPSTRKHPQDMTDYMGAGHTRLTYLESNTPLPNGTRLESSYADNGWLQKHGWDFEANSPQGGDPQNFFYARSFKARYDIQTPYKVPLMMDAAFYEVFTRTSAGPNEMPIDTAQEAVKGWTSSYDRYSMNPAMLDRHLGRTQMVFMDGVVRQVPLMELWQIKWHSLWNDRNNPVLWANPDYTGWNNQDYQWLKRLPN
jgi:hypothetical protein